MKTFKDFVAEATYPVLDVQKGIELYDKILEELPDNDDADQLLHDMLASIRDYAEMRGQWYLMQVSSKVSVDKTRTIYHDSVIVNVNMVKKYLVNHGKDVSCFEAIDDENEIVKRKKYGDFACIVHSLMGIMSR